LIKAIILSCFCISVCQAQITDLNAEPASQEEVDSLAGNEIVDNMFFDIFYGNPGKAALYALVVPGGGQIYNRKWWKLPLVYGVETILILRIIYSNRNYRGFQDAYIGSLTNTMPNEFRGVTDIAVLKSNRDKFRKQREYAYVFFIGGHLITIFEAFIDRHLMEFDISDDLTIGPIPSVIGPIGGVTFTIPLNQKKYTAVSR